MRQYTIAKTLVLSLSVLSVVARSLPERQSEINVRSPGDVSDPTQRLEELGLVKRDTTLEKRDDPDLTHHPWKIQCLYITKEPPLRKDCEDLAISIGVGPFSFGPNAPLVYRLNSCMIKFENPTTTTFSYDFLALTNLAYDVTLECITQNATHGYATFDYEVVDNSMPPNPPFLLVTHNGP